MTTEEFNKTVLESTTLVVVEFSSSSCTSCKVMATRLNDLLKKHKGKFKLVAVDVEDGTLAATYGIRSLPTVIFFKGGKPVFQFVGAVPQNKLEDKIKELIE
jgi:thioredoxin 1